MTVDSGAFATTMPRRVAASTSTLSTPTPARPITLSRSRALDQVAGQLRRGADDDPVVEPDDLVQISVTVDVDVEVLAQQVDAGLRDLLANEYAHYACTGCVVRLERARDRDAALDVRAELGERQLDRRERRRDVEHVEVADVPDAEDLPLQLALARRERDAVAVAQQEQELAGVDSFRRAHGRHDRRGVVVGREQLEPHRLDPLAARAPEADVALERGLEPALEDHPERDVEPQRRARPPA